VASAARPELIGSRFLPRSDLILPDNGCDQIMNHKTEGLAAAGLKPIRINQTRNWPHCDFTGRMRGFLSYATSDLIAEILKGSRRQPVEAPIGKTHTHPDKR